MDSSRADCETLNHLANFPNHSGQIPHNLFIPKADSPQPHPSQNLLAPRIFFLLQIMDIPIHFNDQPRLMVVKVLDETCDNLLSPKMDSQLFPRNSCHTLRSFLGGSHVAATLSIFVF